MNELPKGYFVVGNKLMTTCWYCQKVIQVDKPIFGSLHICLSTEEKNEIDKQRRQNEN